MKSRPMDLEAEGEQLEQDHRYAAAASRYRRAARIYKAATRRLRCEEAAARCVRLALESGELGGWRVVIPGFRPVLGVSEDVARALAGNYAALEARAERMEDPRR